MVWKTPQAIPWKNSPTRKTASDSAKKGKKIEAVMPARAAKSVQR